MHVCASKREGGDEVEAFGNSVSQVNKNHQNKKKTQEINKIRDKIDNIITSTFESV